jgi:hypothetical protein
MTESEYTARKLSDLKPALDHVIVVVEDLERAAHAYEALGFFVSPRSIHPFGTANRLIIFENNFIELLAVHDRATLGPYEAVQKFLEARGGNGAWGIIWQAEAPAELHAYLQERGLSPSALQNRVTREVELPGGRQETACFSSFALLSGNTPTYLEGFSHQHNRAAVFVKDWQGHPNGARNIVRTVLTVGDLGPIRKRWSSIFGQDAIRGDDHILLGDLSGAIEVQKGARASGAATESPVIEQVTIEVDDLGIARCSSTGILGESCSGWAKVSTSRELGISIVFVEPGIMDGQERK